MPATPTSHSRSTRLPPSHQHRAAPALDDRLLLDDDRARLRLVARLGHGGLHHLGGLGAHPRGQHVGAGALELGDDGGDLLRALAEAQHHLGEAGAQVAVMVHLREPEVAERQIGELGEGLVDGGAAALHRLEKLP
jgi:hypothetical protein